MYVYTISSSSWAKFLGKSKVFLKVPYYIEKKAFLALIVAESLQAQW